MNISPRCVTTSCIAALSGGVIATLFESRNLDTAILIVGCVTALVACMFLVGSYVIERVSSEVRAVNRPADKAFELGYEMGHNKGWTEARRAEAPRTIGLAVVEDEAVGV